MVKQLVGVVLGVALVGAIVTLAAFGLREPVVTVTQPIAFNHKVHMTEAKLDCTTVCHAAATTEVYAGLPSKEVCYGCHDPDEETPDKPEKTRLAGFVDLDEDLPWKRVAIVPDHVFFSHRRHVSAGKIECARCHPGVEEAAQPLSQVAQVMTMTNCIECHQHEGADVDCLACHR